MPTAKSSALIKNKMKRMETTKAALATNKPYGTSTEGRTGRRKSGTQLSEILDDSAPSVSLSSEGAIQIQPIAVKA
jgi:hypothetical protein